MVEDLAQASGANTNSEAFAWLQVAAARALEYGWHSHEWEFGAKRQVDGAWVYFKDHLTDRLTGRHSERDARRNELWKLYWWLRLSIARGNGEIPAVEGIRVVCESDRSDVEAILKGMT